MSAWFSFNLLRPAWFVPINQFGQKCINVPASPFKHKSYFMLVFFSPLQPGVLVWVGVTEEAGKKARLAQGSENHTKQKVQTILGDLKFVFFLIWGNRPHSKEFSFNICAFVKSKVSSKSGYNREIAVYIFKSDCSSSSQPGKRALTNISPRIGTLTSS